MVHWFVFLATDKVMLWKHNTNLMYLYKEKKKAVILRLLNYATFMWCPCLKPMFETQPTCLSEETNSSKLTRNYEVQRTDGVGFNKLHQTRCSHLGLKFLCEHKTEQLHFHSVKCLHTCSSVGWKTFGQGLHCHNKPSQASFSFH